MKRNLFLAFIIALSFVVSAYAQDLRPASYAKAPRFKALLLYTEHAEKAHVEFSHQTIDFFKDLTVGRGWILDVATSLAGFTPDSLAGYNTIISVNTAPGRNERALFEEYMENGGGWIGFHAAGYNDRHTDWPWFDQFFGAGTFKCNNWPPQSALLEVDDMDHPVTKNLPKEFVAPASEWYQWEKDLRTNPDIKVLLSLSPKNYPLGLKDIVYGGDWPVVWTNTRYRMIYLNMGHGSTEYIDGTQNLLFVNALRWIVQPGEKPVRRDNGNVVVAYVTSWSKVIPQAEDMTHLNYAFGHVNDSFDGVRIDNPERLRKLVSLKKDKPSLKVMLSVGGWGSGRFSEMAASKKTRRAFAKDCRRVVEEFGLDGIDIDWEYPGSSAAGISSSPDDTGNFTLLMRDLRKALGKGKLLTLASACSADYIDFRSVVDYLDFVNVMSYDMGFGKRLNAPLYHSANAGEWNTDMAVKAHLDAGVPASKLVVGMPFYGRGVKSYKRGNDFVNTYPVPSEYVECWDDDAKVPYLTDRDGNFVFGFDNVRSIKFKCRYVRDNGLRGAMYWDYAGDGPSHQLSRTVADMILR